MAAARFRVATLALLLGFAGGAFTLAAEPKFTNRLAQEKSPYLLQHAHNPVDWFPWGEEAFAKARQENKPIFLSVGYSTCHWCHVMEHESFENEEIAELMNERFVSVKVDREERPDIDAVYMAFVQGTTGGGGWPMSVWLTPELKPFVGGTYFPPEDKSGRPGFKSVLTKIAEAWKNDRARIVESSDKILGQLQGAVAQSGGTDKLSDGIREKGFRQFASNFDEKFGGFGPAPKFPRPVALEFLLGVYGAAPDSKDGKRALEMALSTLRKMAAGGMHDQLGGGFHRYSTDKFWHVPHFEKMLYDQAQLALVYLDAFQITREPVFEETARDILDYVRRELTDREGGFHSAEDADSLVEKGKAEKAEGAFYVWTKDEIDQLLGPERAKVFDAHYGVEKNGNAPDDPQGEFTKKNILSERQSVAETAGKFELKEEKVRALLAESRKVLFDARASRPRPHLDDKIVTAWNGLMISAFARGAQVLDDPAYREAAQKAADFLQARLFRAETNTLLRSYREGASAVEGFASDYAFLIQGLLDLYETSFEVSRLEWALKLQTRQDELFRDAKAGGYFTTSGADANVLLRMKEADDMAEPSANSVSALNLLRVGYLLDDQAARDRAEETLRAFGQQMEAAPSSMPKMLVALGWSRAKPKQIVLAGQLGEAGFATLLREVHHVFLPHRVLILAEGGAGQKFFGDRVEFMKAVEPLDGKATAYVCENFVCQLPTTDLAKLRTLLIPRKDPAKKAP
ncbi:MAG: thioredoxin domain-containing protein [Chthoniobacterales bacterium]